MKVHGRTDFFRRECSDLGVGQLKSVVRICKSIRNIGRSPRSISHESGSPKKYISGGRDTLRYTTSTSPECGDFSFITLLG